MRKVNHGFAVVTGLFVAMLVYLISTILIANSNFSTGFTRHGYLDVRSHFLACAASQKALQRLNTLPNWEAQHTGPQRAQQDVLEDGLMKAWVEKVDDDMVRLFGEGTVGNRTQRVTQLLTKRPAVTAIDYVLEDPSGGRPDQILSKAEDESNWNSVLPPPALQWNSQGEAKPETYPDGKPKYAETLTLLCGDGQGNVYVIWDRADHDEVLRYLGNASPPRWELLPPVVDETGQRLAPSLEGIAVNEKTDLVVLDQKSGSDALFHLNLKSLSQDPESTTWTRLPLPVGGSFRRGQFVSDPQARGLLHVSQVSLDNKGRMYLLAKGQSPPPIYRFQPTGDWSTGEWKVLPAPPDLHFEPGLKGGSIRQVLVKDRSAMNLDYLAVDPPTGEVFTRYARPSILVTVNEIRSGTVKDSPSVSTPVQKVVPQIDTIFRFAPKRKQQGMQMAGDWFADPLPPPNIYFDRTGHQNTGSGQADLTYNTVDHASNYLGLWPTSGDPDTIFGCQLSNKVWHTLPPVPQNFYKIDPSTHDLVPNYDPGFASHTVGLGGGGIQRIPGLFRYVVTASY